MTLFMPPASFHRFCDVEALGAWPGLDPLGPASGQSRSISHGSAGLDRQVAGWWPQLVWKDGKI